MKKVKKKYVGKVKKRLLAKCPTCKAKGYKGWKRNAQIVIVGDI